MPLSHTLLDWQLVVQLLLFHPKTAPKVISEGLKFSWGDMSPTCHTPLARALCTLYVISHVHTGTLLFKILDPPLYRLCLQWSWSYYGMGITLTKHCTPLNCLGFLKFMRPTWDKFIVFIQPGDTQITWRWGVHWLQHIISLHWQFALFLIRMGKLRHLSSGGSCTRSVEEVDNKHHVNLVSILTSSHYVSHVTFTNFMSPCESSHELCCVH